MNDIIILRSVFGKVGQTYYFQPCADPRTGRFPDHVKTIDKNGDMILSESDKEEMSKGSVVFIKINEIFEFESGKTFDLSDLYDWSVWEAIKHNSTIAKERNAKDDQGNYLIDGGKKYYGTAELYVERPGEEVKKRVSSKELTFKAQRYIYEDAESELIKKCRVLGRDYSNAAPADIKWFLLEHAEKDPNKVIALYEDDGWKLHLFILDAVDRGVITKQEGIFRYDDKMLGGSIESVMILLKDFKYKAILDSIKRDTYPDFRTKAEIDQMIKESELAVKEAVDNSPIKPAPKTRAKT